MFDGYDEYTGKRFLVLKDLKRREWVNTIVSVTSRHRRYLFQMLKSTLITMNKKANQEVMIPMLL